MRPTDSGARGLYAPHLGEGRRPLRTRLRPSRRRFKLVAAGAEQFEVAELVAVAGVEQDAVVDLEAAS